MAGEGGGLWGGANAALKALGDHLSLGCWLSFKPDTVIGTGDIVGNK